MYKLLTGVLANRLQTYLLENNLMPVEQKGCAPGRAGCKDQLLASKAIMEDCKYFKKNLNLIWIDYKKAYDSVPHDWIIKSLEMIGANEKLVNICTRVMQMWRTTITLKAIDGVIDIPNVRINRGILQGDSLSPLQFCVCLIPLSKLLGQTKTGYKLEGGNRKISHLLYMDDLKLIAVNDRETNKQLKITRNFSDDICMQFGIDKCARVTVKKGKPTRKDCMYTNEVEDIKELEPEAVYKYLGIEENSDIQHRLIKERLTKEYNSRVRTILRTELNSGNKIKAIGELAVPVLQYSFGIINWKLEEIRKIDIKTRKLLTIHHAHHPKADVDRIYVNRKTGGRGLKQLEGSFKAAMINTAEYLKEKSRHDAIIRCILAHDQKNYNKYSVTNIAKQLMRQEGLNRSEYNKEHVKETIASNIGKKWKEKAMHGQYPRGLEAETIDSRNTCTWLVKGELKIETESLVVAAQDQAITTNYVANKIHGTGVDSKCRLCKSHIETIDHIMTACPVLANTSYIERHDNVCKLLHYNICRSIGVPTDTDKWYQHEPKTVVCTDDNQYVMLWNQQIITDRTVRNNKPDIVLKDLHKKETLLIDVAIPNDATVARKESEKILKYRDLEVDIRRMWNMKTNTIPVVIGATGTVSKAFSKYIKKLPGWHSAKEIQKQAILGTAHIIRKTLM